jgi:hypothetical protein
MSRQDKGGAMLTPADIGYFQRRLEAQRETVQHQILSLEQSMASPDVYEEAMQEQGDDALYLRGHDDAWDQYSPGTTDCTSLTGM